MKKRPPASYVDFLNLGVNWQQTHQLSGISGQLEQIQNHQLVGTSKVLGKLEDISSSLSGISTVMNRMASMQWQILEHIQNEIQRQELIGQLRFNLHNIKREVIRLGELGQTKPFFALYHFAALVNLIENSGWRVEHFARESFADLETAQSIHDLLERSGQKILDEVGPENPIYFEFETDFNEIYSLLHEKALRKISIEELSSQFEQELNQTNQQISEQNEILQTLNSEQMMLEKILLNAGLDVNSDKKVGFFKQLSIGNKLAKLGHGDIFERIEQESVKLAKVKMTHDQLNLKIVQGGYFYNFEAEIIGRKREQEEKDKIADRRIDELGKKWEKQLP